MRWLKPLCITVLAGFVIAFGVYIQGMTKYQKDYRNTTRIRLDTPVIYDEECKKQMAKLDEEDISCVLWNEKRNVLIENKDFSRALQVDGIGAAGDTSCLFPNGNALGIDDTEYCLLGTHTSEELFGSINSVGRRVTVNGREYIVAGVIYQISDLFVYELDSQEGEAVTEMLYRYDNKSKKQLVKQKLENTCGFTGKEQKKGWDGIKEYFNNI